MFDSLFSAFIIGLALDGVYHSFSYKVVQVSTVAYIFVQRILFEAWLYIMKCL